MQDSLQLLRDLVSADEKRTGAVSRWPARMTCISTRSGVSSNAATSCAAYRRSIRR